MLTAEPKGYGSSWYAATRAESPARARLSVELDVDVCVIGGGLAGLTAAREVARRGWSVIVLEGQSVAWDASGRNAGVVRAGFAMPAQALVERVGLEHARELWALSVDGAEYVRSAARDIEDAALSETGLLHVSRSDDTRAMAAEAALMVGEFGARIEPWAMDRVREVLDTNVYFHGLHDPNAFSLHPLNYALGLAAAAEAAGARIFEDTPVLEIDPAGVRKRLVTNQSRVRAAHVVLAGNVHIGGLLPEFAGTLVPSFNYVVVTEPLDTTLGEAIRFPGAVSDNETGDDRYRVVDGNRLLCCGDGTTWQGNPQRHGEALLSRIAELYPTLGAAKAGYAWAGMIGETVHGMPQIGEVSPGLWLLSGFGNHGVNTTAMAGEIVARAIVEGDRTWEAFAPFSLVWAGGRLGRAAKQASAWSGRARGLAGAIMSRRREVKRLKAEAHAAQVKQFAGLAAAAAAPPEPAAAQIHPSIAAIEASEPATAPIPPQPVELPPEVPVLIAESVAPLPIETEPPIATPQGRRKPKRDPAERRGPKRKKSDTPPANDGLPTEPSAPPENKS